MNRRSYSRIIGCNVNSNYPLTLNRLEELNNSYSSSYLIQNWDVYKRCKVKSIFSTSNEITTNYAFQDNFGFQSLIDMVQWINDNVPNNGVSFSNACHFEVYDEVSTGVPAITRVYGKNTRFASLRGRFYLGNDNNTHAGPNYNNAAAFLQRVWGQLWGGQLHPGGIAAWGTPEFACFWMARSKKSFYTCPSPQILNVDLNSGPNSRNMSLLVGGNRVPATASFWPTTAGSPRYYIVSDAKDSTSSEFHEEYRGNLLEDWFNGRTLIAAYKMEDVAGNRAILIKPVGVDSFYFNFFDDTKYQLEAVSSKNNNSSALRLQIINTSGAFKSPGQNSYGPIELHTLLPTIAKKWDFDGRTYKPADVYFQLRDLRTNKVSIISYSYLKWFTHQGATTLKPVVQTRPLGF